jgi:hypothetical protein
MGCLYTSWHCCIPSLRFTAHIDKVGGLADGADALSDLLALGAEALEFLVRRLRVLGGLLQAWGACGGRPGPPVLPACCPRPEGALARAQAALVPR